MTDSIHVGIEREGHAVYVALRQGRRRVTLRLHSRFGAALAASLVSVCSDEGLDSHEMRLSGQLTMTEDSCTATR